MHETKLMDALKKALGERIVEITNPYRRRLFITVSPEDVVACLILLRDKYSFTFLSTITGLDLGDTYEIIYHLATKETNLNLKTRIPKDNPKIHTISLVIPGAILYERELQDMFGIIIDNIPDARPLLLPDDWPAGNYPLRKDWSFKRPEEIIPGGKS